LREVERREVVLRLDVERRDVAFRPRVLVALLRLDEEELLRLRDGLRFLPPPVSLFTVAQALRADSRPPTPRFS
jgi:hypothetical protein